MKALPADFDSSDLGGTQEPSMPLANLSVRVPQSKFSAFDNQIDAKKVEQLKRKMRKELS